MANISVDFSTGAVVQDPSYVAPSFPAQSKMIVTARQARLALDAAGILDDVEAAVAASPRAVQLAWEYATEVERDNALLLDVASKMSPPFTAEQLDALFIEAAKL